MCIKAFFFDCLQSRHTNLCRPGWTTMRRFLFQDRRPLKESFHAVQIDCAVQIRRLLTCCNDCADITIGKSATVTVDNKGLQFAIWNGRCGTDNVSLDVLNCNAAGRQAGRRELAPRGRQSAIRREGGGYLANTMICGDPWLVTVVCLMRQRTS